MKKQVDFSRDYNNHTMKEVFVEANEMGKKAPLVTLSEILEGITGGAVCIAANSCTDLIANDICGTLNHREVRQYVLLSDKKSSKRILGEKYVRILSIPQNGMILAHILNEKVKTWLFSNPDSSEGYEIKSNDIYKSFCNLFWSKKVLCEYRGDDVEREPDSPLTQDIAVDDRCSMPGQATDVVERYQEDLFLQDVKSELSTDRFAQLHISDMPGSERACLSSTGASDLFTPGSVSGFSLVGDGNVGYLLPTRVEDNAVNWSVPLTAKDYGVISQSFGCSWKYISDIKLEKTVGKTIRYADAFSKKIDIGPTETVTTDYRCKTIEEYQNKTMIEESFMATVDESRPSVAHIDYKVTATPPLVPSKSTRDPLHKTWEDKTKEWTTALEGLKAECGKYCDMVSGLGGSIASSFGKKKDDLCSQIDVLIESNISIMSKAKRDLKVRDYAELCEKCESYRVDCDKEVQKDKFIKKQRARIQSLEGDIADLQKKVNASEEQLDKLKSSEAKEKVIKKETEKLEGLRNNLGNKQNELKREKESIYKYEENTLHSSNRIVAKTFSFPSEELPVYNGASLHSADGMRYLSIPDSSEESCLTDQTLLQDVQRLKAILVVRE